MAIGAQIAGIVVLNTSLNTTCLIRIWYLRRRPHVSPAARAADILYYSMVGISLFQTCVMYYRLAQVKKVEDNPPPPELKPLVLLEKRFLMPLFIETVGYAFNIYLIKGAFLALYYDLLQHLGKTLRWALHACALLNVGFFLMTFIMTFTWCRPLSSYWVGGVKTCSILTNLTSMNIITWASVVMDAALVVIPTFIFRSLKLRRREAWAIGFVYLVGLTSVGATLVRYAVVYAFIKDAENADPETVNKAELWGSIEVVFGGLAFVLPTFRALIRRSTTTPASSAAGRSGYLENSSRGTGSKKSFPGMSLFSRTEAEAEDDEIQLKTPVNSGQKGASHISGNEIQVSHSIDVNSKKGSNESLGLDNHSHHHQGFQQLGRPEGLPFR